MGGCRAWRSSFFRGCPLSPRYAIPPGNKRLTHMLRKPLFLLCLLLSIETLYLPLVPGLRWRQGWFEGAGGAGLAIDPPSDGQEWPFPFFPFLSVASARCDTQRDISISQISGLKVLDSDTLRLWLIRVRLCRLDRFSIRKLIGPTSLFHHIENRIKILRDENGGSHKYIFRWNISKISPHNLIDLEGSRAVNVKVRHSSVPTIDYLQSWAVYSLHLFQSAYGKPCYLA